MFFVTLRRAGMLSAVVSVSFCITLARLYGLIIHEPGGNFNFILAFLLSVFSSFLFFVVIIGVECFSEHVHAHFGDLPIRCVGRMGIKAAH